MIKQIIERIRDIALELFFIGVTAIVTAFLPTESSLSVVVVVILCSLLLYFGMVVLRTWINRPFYSRYPNEEAARDSLAKIIASTKKQMDIMSKVGTTIFFLFDEYVNVLSRGDVTINLILVNPFDKSLIATLDKMFTDSDAESERWERMKSNILERIQKLYSNQKITLTDKNELVDTMESFSGYKGVILASIYLWRTALRIADERFSHTLKDKGINYSGGKLDSLHIYLSASLPNTKAWISDKKCGVIGTYSSLRLGKDNPIDIYKPNVRNNGQERSYFENILDEWNYKLEHATEYTE